jgi:hypothetical protein
MTEPELLDRTRLLAQQAQLPAALELGKTWAIVRAVMPSMPPLASERYQQDLAALKDRYPDDAHEFVHTRSGRTTQYLLVRAGSPGLRAWLAGL